MVQLGGYDDRTGGEVRANDKGGETNWWMVRWRTDMPSVTLDAQER